jgi:hypothetical protein
MYVLLLSRPRRFLQLLYAQWMLCAGQCGERQPEDGAKGQVGGENGRRELPSKVNAKQTDAESLHYWTDQKSQSLCGSVKDGE